MVGFRQPFRRDTHDAYVGAETARVTALSPGPVAKIFVSETQAVKKGDPLVVIDDADARIAVAQSRSGSQVRPSAR
ncbi:biotin/lipoyl-binding protein [Caulobacter segnis]